MRVAWLVCQLQLCLGLTSVSWFDLSLLGLARHGLALSRLGGKYEGRRRERLVVCSAWCSSMLYIPVQMATSVCFKHAMGGGIFVWHFLFRTWYFLFFGSCYFLVKHVCLGGHKRSFVAFFCAPS